MEVSTRTLLGRLTSMASSLTRSVLSFFGRRFCLLELVLGMMTFGDLALTGSGCCFCSAAAAVILIRIRPLALMGVKGFVFETSCKFCL